LLPALAVGLLLPQQAAGGTRPDEKVDAVVEALAAEAPSAATKLHVIVLGKDLDAAQTDSEADVRHRLRTIHGEAMTVRAGKLKRLVDHDGVLRVLPDLPVQPDTIGVPLAFPSLTTLYPKIIGMPSAWNGGYSGAGVGIAVLDSGVQPIADFGTRLVQAQLPGQTSTGDSYGHGTFVAAIAAGSNAGGSYVGVAPGATVYAVRAAGADGSVYSSDVISGLDWVLANHVQYNIRVVNLSLSESATSSYLSSPLDTAVERVWRDGVVVVTSAGNRGSGAISYAPANDPFAITVGATDPNNTLSTSDDTVATFSSGGTTQDGYAKPDLLAPGRQISSALPAGTTLALQAPLGNLLVGGYATMSGTSFAAPQVAGAAALLFEAHPNWTPDQVKAALVQSGQSMSGGSGRILSVSAATTLSGPPNPANQGLTQSSYGLDTSSTGTTNTASWNTASWNTAAWNYSSWD
jgi:serine protease AprX